MVLMGNVEMSFQFISCVILGFNDSNLYGFPTLICLCGVSQHFLEGTSKFWRGNVWLSGWEAFIQYIWSIYIIYNICIYIYRWKERIFDAISWDSKILLVNNDNEWSWIQFKHNNSTPPGIFHISPPSYTTDSYRVRIHPFLNGLQWPAFPQRSAWYKTPKEQKPWHRLESCGSGLVTPAATLLQKGFN